MLDKLFKKVDKAKDKAKAQKSEAEASSEGGLSEDMLDETGTFMLDVNQLKDCEDLEDLLNDV